MATLYKKPNSPFWFAQYFNAEGKRISRSTGTAKKREADKIAAGLETKEAAIRDGKPGMPSAFAVIVETAAREATAGELTLARAEELVQRLHQLANPDFHVVSLDDHLGEWVAAQERHVIGKTLKIYEDMRRRVVAAVGPRAAAAPVGELTKEDVERAMVKIKAMMVKKTERTLTAATVNMDLRALRRALHSAVEQGLAKVNVAQTIRVMSEDDSTERAPFTTAEVRAMLKHKDTTKEWHGVILIAAHTGLRLGDVVSLGRGHVEGDRIVIRPQKTQRDKKTLSVPLTPAVVGWIGKKQGDFFPSLKGTKTGTLSTNFTRIMKRAGVARDIIEAGGITKRRSFHSLRHTFASWLAEADVHADIRQKLTGHSSSRIHGKYTHHDASLDRAIKTLPTLTAATA